MECLIFAKKRTTREGKTFYVYLTELTNKSSGEILKNVQVKFKEGVKRIEPTECPCYAEVQKEGSNLSTKIYKREDTGEDAIRYTLWVSGYKLIPNKTFVDHSLDDFD